MRRPRTSRTATSRTAASGSTLSGRGGGAASLVAAACGAAAVAGYLAATVLGAAARPGYSHVADPISELTSAHAPHRTVLAAGYVLYNLAVAAFGFALRRALGGRRLLTAAAWLLAAGAVAGIGQVTAFPQDPGGAPTTAAGTAHVVLAGASALLTVAVTVVVGMALRARGQRRAARFSLGCTAALLLTGPVAAASAGSAHLGAAERLPIGTFLVWLAGMSAVAARRRHTPTSDDELIAAVDRPAGQ